MNDLSDRDAKIMLAFLLALMLLIAGVFANFFAVAKVPLHSISVTDGG